MTFNKALLADNSGTTSKNQTFHFTHTYQCTYWAWIFRINYIYLRIHIILPL